MMGFLDDERAEMQQRLRQHAAMYEPLPESATESQTREALAADLEAAHTRLKRDGDQLALRVEEQT
jgi:hypothetical protein